MNLNLPVSGCKQICLSHYIRGRLDTHLRSFCLKQYYFNKGSVAKHCVCIMQLITQKIWTKTVSMIKHQWHHLKHTKIDDLLFKIFFAYLILRCLFSVFYFSSSTLLLSVFSLSPFPHTIVIMQMILSILLFPSTQLQLKHYSPSRCSSAVLFLYDCKSSNSSPYNTRLNSCSLDSESNLLKFTTPQSTPPTLLTTMAPSYLFFSDQISSLSKSCHGTLFYTCSPTSSLLQINDRFFQYALYPVSEASCFTPSTSSKSTALTLLASLTTSSVDSPLS